MSRIIIDDIHRRIGHLGKNSILTVLKQKYWIVGANSIIKIMLSKCVTCKRYQGGLGEQKMANLPKERLVSDEMPFSNIGIDFFGPFYAKRGRSQVKRYGVIFTCMLSRAVHLEVAHSLNTDFCINALRRFISRRGTPKLIRTDNGTNFIGAERELREEIERWNNDRMNNFLLQKSIKWEFNPPYSSHFGGVWKRLIRSVRKVLYSVLREQSIRLDDEGLQTLFFEIEGILNGRPLTEMPNSVNELEVLTPNHLLLLHPGERFPPGTFQKADNYAKRRRRQIQYLANVFWTRWRKEYLPLLQSRQKWNKRFQNFSVGGLVLLVDNMPRNSWSLGKILETFKGSGDIVCVVKLKTLSGTLV